MLGLVFIFVNYVFARLQQIYWRITGTWSEIQVRRSGKYETCAQVLNIVARRMAYPYYIQQKEVFMTVHDSFTHPRDVLVKDVTLYNVTPEEAVFVRCPSNVDPCKSDVNPFMYLAQYDNATQLIILPIKHFLRLASEVRETKSKIIFLYSTGRCGSTLITQVMETIPGGVCLSEPPWTLGLGDLRRQGRLTEGVLNACVNIACHSTRDSSLFYCIKLASWSTDLMELVATELPNAKTLFMYRKSPIKTFDSFVKVLGSMLPSLCFLPVVRWFMADEWARIFLVGQPTICDQLLDVKDIFILHLSVVKQMFTEFAETYDCISLTYEDFVEKADVIMENVLEFCELRFDGITFDTQRVFGRDSQQNTFVDRRLAKVYTSEEDQKFRRRLRHLAVMGEACGLELPFHGETWQLPKTIC